MRTALLALLVTTACGGKGDDCARFWDKSAPVLAKAGAGKPMPADAKDKFLEQCRETDKMKNDPVFKCVLDANGEAAVAECTTKAFSSYMDKSKKTEAQLMLNRLGKMLKVAHAENAAFPIGKGGPTPAEPCCKGEGGKCPVDEAQWNVQPWQTLDFISSEPGRFQYTYESADGKSAKATAIGDLDCDGTTITYTLEMTVDETGNPKMNIVEPTNPD